MPIIVNGDDNIPKTRPTGPEANNATKLVTVATFSKVAQGLLLLMVSIFSKLIVFIIVNFKFVNNIVNNYNTLRMNYNFLVIVFKNTQMNLLFFNIELIA